MAAPGGGWFRSEDRGGSWSQVLQGLLSLLRVTVIAVAAGPLAEGLIGQMLLISGEEAKQSLDRRLGLGRHSRVGNGWNQNGERSLWRSWAEKSVSPRRRR